MQANSEMLDEAVGLAKRSPDGGLVAEVLLMAALFVVGTMAVGVEEYPDCYRIQVLGFISIGTNSQSLI